MNRRWIILFVILSMVSLPLSFVKAQVVEQELLGTAQQAFNDGFSDVAIRYLEDFRQQFPQSPKINAAKILLGQSYFLKGQYDDALEIFKGLLDQADNKDVILFWLAESYLKLGQGHLARGYYELVIKDFPSSPFVPQAYYSLAWVYFDQKNFTQARLIFGQLIKLFPDHQFSEDAMLKMAECDFNNMHFEAAVQSFESYALKYPKNNNTCMVNVSIAESLYYLERFNDALGYYQHVRDGSCDDQVRFSALMGSIWSVIKLKNFPQVELLYKSAMDLAKLKGYPLDDLLFLQANISFEQGNYEEAITGFSDFITRFPQSPRVQEAYLARANVYFLLKRYEEADADYKHISTSADPDLKQKAMFGLGWSQIKLGHTADAVKHFEAVATGSEDVQVKANAFIQIADAYQDSGHYDDALHAYERVLSAYPNNALADYAQYRRAIALLKSSKMDQAILGFEQLRAQFPSSKYLEDIDYYLGVASFKAGDWKKAVLTLENFIKGLLRPSEFTPEANYILALAYLNLKQPQEALRVFQKILRLYPDAANVAQNADIGIAKCQFELGQIKDAVKRFKLIVYKYPRTPSESESMLWLAQYYLKNAQYQEAVDYYRALIERFPDNAQMDQIHYELGQAYEIQGQTDLGLEQYKKISAKDKALLAKAKLSIAGILSKDLEPQRAIAAYESIILTNPDFASDAYLRLGQLYRNAQNYEKEIDVYQKALKSGDDKGQINKAQLQFNIADTLELMSRTDEAIEQYLKIAQTYPQEKMWVIKAYLRVAKIYEEGKDWGGAQVVYQKIIQLDTEESKYAQERLDWIKHNVVLRKTR